MIRVVLNLSINFERTNILKILSLLDHEHSTSFHCFRLFLTSPNNYFSFQYKGLSNLVKGIPRRDLQDGRGVKTWRSPSSPEIHQKYIYMWNNSYRTPTECWQKTSDFPKGKKIPTYLGRAKEKRKKRDKRIGNLWEGAVKEEVSTH